MTSVLQSCRAEPSRAEPSRAEPSRAEPSRAEPSRAEPSRAEPSRAEPSRAEPSRADCQLLLRNQRLIRAGLTCPEGRVAAVAIGSPDAASERRARPLPRLALAVAGLLLALAAPHGAHAQTSCNVSSATTEATGAFNWHRISSNSGANLPAATVFYRALIAFGVSPLPAWTGSNISGNAPTTPITAAEVRTFQGANTWSGWDPILAALDCLEAQVVTPGPDPDPDVDDFGPDPVPDTTLPVGPTHMPQIVLNRDELVVEEPQADSCSDDKVGNEQTFTTVGNETTAARDYGEVLTAVGYKVALDRSPGAGKYVSVEIWDPTDLDRPDVTGGYRNDGRIAHTGRFSENARIHGISWDGGRQGRITVANSEVPATGVTAAAPLLNTYHTFTDENWDEPRKVKVNVHCAQHDVTDPLPVWHFAFRHNVPRPVNPGSGYPNGGAEELPLGYETNRKGDNGPNNTSLKIAEVRVADRTEPAAITGNVDGKLVLDAGSGPTIGGKKMIDVEFVWNHPDNSLGNDYDDANAQFAAFRVKLRTVEPAGHPAQEKIVRIDYVSGKPKTAIGWYVAFEAKGHVGWVPGRPDPADAKYEWNVVPLDRRWNEVEAERVTQCVLLTSKAGPNGGRASRIDKTANPTCPAAQNSEGAGAPAVSVPDTAVANVQATAVDDTSASVSWDAVEHAAAYEVSWDGSGSQTAVIGILPGVTGTTTTIEHNAEEAMTLTVTVTPEYVDGNGQVVQLPSLAGTATLDVGPQPLNGGGTSGGGTSGGGDGGQVQAGEGESSGTASLALPVAHWHLDGDALDHSGSSHGTGGGGAAFAANEDGSGVGSHALVLDGIDDHVDLASHVSNLPLGDAARTVAGWFRADAGGQGQTFLAYGPNAAGQRFSIAADRTQALVAVSGHARGVNGLDLDDGWHHVAVTYAGGNSDGISIYLDGALQAASTLVGAPQPVDTRAGPAAIGRSVSGAAHYAGSIDDVRVYDVALGAEQVLALFNEHPQAPPPTTTAVTASASPSLAEGNLDGADVELTLDAGAFAATVATSDVTASGVSGVGVSSVTRDGDGRATATLAFDGTDFDADATLTLTVSAGALAHSDAALSATLPVAAVDEPPPPPAASIPAPVAHWQFDGDAGDSAGSSNGSARNGASFTTAASVGSHALSLDGSDDYVDLAPHVSNFPLGNSARSVTGWFRADAGGQGQTFFVYGPNVEGKRLSIAADRTQALVAVSGHAWGVNGLSLADGWHHVAVTFPGGRSDDFSIYLDGALQSASTLGGVRRQVDTRSGTAAIGRSVSGAAHYGGDIDDVRLYGYALSAEQVRAIAARENGGRTVAVTPDGPMPALTTLRRLNGGSTGASGSGGASLDTGAEPAGTPEGGGPRTRAPLSADARAPSFGGRAHVPLLPNSSNPLREGLVRIANPSARAGEVRITAVDDAGWRRAPVVLNIGAGESLRLSSHDLERGNAALGLIGSTGPGTGDWRLEVSSELDVQVLPYARAADGALSAMGDVAPAADNVHRVSLFNPADSPDAASRLRLTNRGGQALRAKITGIDDAGDSPGGTVSVEIAAGGSVLLTAAELEAGGANLLGALGDGEGQWRLDIASDGDLAVMNLVETPDGRLANLSGAAPTAVPARRVHVVAGFPPSSEASNERGVLRIANSTDSPASIRIEAHDSAGWRYAPLTLTLGANEAANLGAWDLELGNSAKGLSGGAGPGAGGAWRLEISGDGDIAVLAYVRASNGLLKPLPGDAETKNKAR